MSERHRAYLKVKRVSLVAGALRWQKQDSYGMDDILLDFITESNEGLSLLDTELTKLEKNPEDKEILANIFRVMHTIKGTCGFLALSRLEAVAHAGESVLGKVRDGELEVTADLVSLILQCLDRIRMILGEIEAKGEEPGGDDQDLLARLQAALSGKADGEGADWSGETSATGPGDAELSTACKEPESDLQVVPSQADKAEGEATPDEKAAPAGASAPPSNAAMSPQSSVANQSIRVNVGLIENLITTVSELVLTRNQLLQLLRSGDESDFVAPLQRLNLVVSELQEGVMKTRMQPIGNAWAKLPRIVRDLGQDLGKKIELLMEGEETELDRQVLELIKDPLTHMVRNSADHGLEMPDARTAAGKNETGTIKLTAFHEGGHIIIKIIDDGRGLNVERIRQKVLGNGLAREDELAAMTDQQIMQFIFKPGFSTAEAVTAVSGRGVGMDVVRSNIEKIGGTVELTSEPGKGSCFTIKIPLTLAIISALIVACAGERFAVPQLSVVELVRASSTSGHTVERIKDTPVLRLRNRLLPLVRLRDVLQLEGEPEKAPEGQQDHFIVVTRVGSYTFGIIVDQVFDIEEIVVKPVSPILRNISLYSGNTILGDGSVIMILDPNGVAAKTGELSVADETSNTASAASVNHDSEQIAVLVFRSGDKRPKAVPLALISRLEEVDLADLEYAGNQPVMQYRGHLMPLVSLSEGGLERSDQRKPVLVFADRYRSMGLVVDEILDIVDERLKVELAGREPGITGTATISGKATDIIDTGFYLTQAFPEWFAAAQQEADACTSKRLLLVDDSAFFRHLLAPILCAAGYRVTAADSPEAALELCRDGEVFDIIISDIEMPGMNGYQFAEVVRDTHWAAVPMIALSSHAGPEDIERGRLAGFRGHVAKMDRERLLAMVDAVLSGKGTGE